MNLEIYQILWSDLAAVEKKCLALKAVTAVNVDKFDFANLCFHCRGLNTQKINSNNKK